MSGLILIPTELELAIIQPEIDSAASEQGWSIELCGFGPIASASRSASLIEQQKPEQVLLLGIAGAFADSLPIGDAVAFDRVCCYGIGVGVGDQFQSPMEIGFQHFQRNGISIDDCLDLSTSSAESTRSQVLLTVPAASANRFEAEQKLKFLPDAIAEDMEGFSVAVSCRLAGVPLTIIRGISNSVGERDHKHWQVNQALIAAAKLAMNDVLVRPSP